MSPVTGAKKPCPPMSSGIDEVTAAKELLRNNVYTYWPGTGVAGQMVEFHRPWNSWRWSLTRAICSSDTLNLGGVGSPVKLRPHRQAGARGCGGDESPRPPRD